VTVRCRFAPAPSGSLHVGNVRSALFSWLWARHNDGVFILRVEDTDASRVTEEAFRGVLDDLRWLGLEWDEGPEAGGPHGPYRQSERAEIYRAKLEELLAGGHAYRCYCTEASSRSATKPLGHAASRPVTTGIAGNSATGNVRRTRPRHARRWCGSGCRTASRSSTTS